MKTQTYSFKAFVSDGKLIPTAGEQKKKFQLSAMIAGGTMGTLAQMQSSAFADIAVPVTTSLAPTPDLNHAFDSVIEMLQQLAFPVAMTVLAWACLQAMIGKPAMAVDRAKWAIIGYLAMRYMPELLRHV